MAPRSRNSTLSRSGSRSIGHVPLVVGSILLLFYCATLGGNACAAEIQIGRVEIGLAGIYRTDRWMPATVELPFSNDGVASVELLTRASSNGRTLRHVLPIEGQGERRRATAAILPGRFDEAEVIVRNRQREIVARRPLATTTQGSRSLPRALAANEDLILVAGRLRGLDAIGLQRRGDAANDSADGSGATLSVRPHFASFDSIPMTDAARDRGALDAVLALDAASTIVVVNPAAISRQPDQPVWHAIGAWVRSGGRLVLGIRSPDGALHRDAASADPVRALHLGTVAGSVEVRQLTALESFAGGGAEGGNKSLVASPLVAVRFKPAAGQESASVADDAGSIPLVAQIPYGLGEIVVVTFSLDDDALQNVAWRGRLLEKIVLPRAMQPVVEKSALAQSSAASAAWQGKGYTDLGEQLADALDRFDGAGPQMFWIFFAAALLFIALIGPLGWYVVQHQPQWIWATFAGSIAIVGVGAYLGAHWSKGMKPEARQIDFVDVDLTSLVESGAPRMVGRSIAAVYGPPRPDTAIAISPQSSSEDRLSDARIGFWPLRLRGARGMSPGTTAGPRVARDTIDEFDFPPWSSEVISAAWSAPLPSSSAGNARMSLSRDAFGHAVGSFRNPLSVPLRDATLLFGDSATPLGAIAPNQLMVLDAHNVWSSAEAHLNRRRLLQDRESAQTYDAASTDLARIGEIISLDSAAGGKKYVHLEHRAVEQLDVSATLRRGQAVLLATADLTSQLKQRSPHSFGPTASPNEGFDPALEPVIVREGISIVRILLPVDQ
jgi:hypothetical protein